MKQDQGMFCDRFRWLEREKTLFTRYIGSVLKFQ